MNSILISWSISVSCLSFHLFLFSPSKFFPLFPSTSPFKRTLSTLWEGVKNNQKNSVSELSFFFFQVQIRCIFLWHTGCMTSKHSSYVQKDKIYKVIFMWYFVVVNLHNHLFNSRLLSEACKSHWRIIQVIFDVIYTRHLSGVWRINNIQEYL